MSKVLVVINNSYHIRELLRLELGSEITVLAICHNLKIKDLEKINYSKCLLIPDPVKLRSLDLFKLNKYRNQISDLIDSEEFNDLILFSEYEPFNHYVAYRAYEKKGIKSTLSEDGGMASYIPNLVREPSPKIRDKFKNFVYSFILGIKGSTLFSIGHETFFRLNNKVVKRIIYTKPVPIKRQVQVEYKNLKIKERKGSSDEILLLNQPFLNNLKEHENILLNFVRQLLSEFKVVHLKFHPRDPIDFQKSVVSKIHSKRLNILETKINIEELHSKMNFKYVTGFYTAALLSYLDLGFIVKFEPNRLGFINKDLMGYIKEVVNHIN
ncbi:alpha-2,8-polysialyltransferase family protein [SAR86 cluster bacterium]|nr:alpha-2,8-polysialyltransferase family protein [SAR86 cluster bacterium]